MKAEMSPDNYADDVLGILVRVHLLNPIQYLCPCTTIIIIIIILAYRLVYLSTINICLPTLHIVSHETHIMEIILSILRLINNTRCHQLTKVNLTIALLHDVSSPCTRHIYLCRSKKELSEDDLHYHLLPMYAMKFTLENFPTFLPGC